MKLKTCSRNPICHDKVVHQRVNSDGDRMWEPMGYKTVPSHTKEALADFPLFLNLLEQVLNISVYPRSISETTIAIGPATLTFLQAG